MKIHILEVNLCFRFLGELERIKKYLWLNDHELVEDIESSDCVMLFGCAFNNYTEEESYKAYLDLRQRIGTSKELYLLEGIADTMGNALVKRGELERRCVIPNRKYHKLDPFFGSKVSYLNVGSANKIGQYSIDNWKLYQGKIGKPLTPEDEYQIKVGWGCNDNCAFCGDKVVVKQIRSKALTDCLEEVSRGVALGYRVISLVGDDVGAWGLDIGDYFVTLLEKVLAVAPDFQLRAYEINAKYLHRHLGDVERVLRSGRIRDIVIAFQSGNDRILNLMKREPGHTGLVELITLFTRYHVPVHSHVMVGFPSETFEEFMDSVRLVESTELPSVSFFMYQDRATAPAFNINPKVSEDEKLRRMAYLKDYFSSRNYQVYVRDDKVSIVKQTPSHV